MSYTMSDTVIDAVVARCHVNWKGKYDLTNVDPQALRDLARAVLAETMVTHELCVSASVLSRRERDVVQLMAKGMTNKEIAVALSVSLGTVNEHNKSLLHKLGFTTRTEAAVWAVKQGIA